jgi:hypothetical protein
MIVLSEFRGWLNPPRRSPQRARRSTKEKPESKELVALLRAHRQIEALPEFPTLRFVTYIRLLDNRIVAFVTNFFRLSKREVEFQKERKWHPHVGRY